MQMQEPRAVRNNNPGNINAGQVWQGLCPLADMTPDQREEARFAVFKSPEWGFRAMAILIRNYRRLHGADTVRKIISVWAPPSENNMRAYIVAVSGETGFLPDAPIDQTEREVMFKLVKAITTHETGCWLPWWADEDLNKGLDLAGFAST